MTEHPYVQSRIVRVFRTRSYLNAYDDEGTVYQGCLRPGGKPLRVAVDLEDGEYPPEVMLRRLTVSGAYVGALSEVGEASQAECEKYATANPAACPVPIADVHVVDMRTRHAVNVEEPAGTTSLELSPSGAVAWLVPQAGGGSALEAGALETHAGKLTLSTQQLDSGTITNVRFHGFTLTWTNGGTAHSVTLGHVIEKSSCRTVDVSTSRNSSKQTVDRCERLNVGFVVGTQGQIVPVWELASKLPGKILKLGKQGYEGSDPTGETTQFFILKAVGAGTTAVKFIETTASSHGALETFELHIRVREILGGTTTTVTTPTVTTTPGPAPAVDAGFRAGHSLSRSQ